MHCFRQKGSWRIADGAVLRTGRLPYSPAGSALSRTRRLDVNPRRNLLHTYKSPTTTTIYPAVHAHLQNTTPRRAPRVSPQPTTTPVRYCSHRRSMCRHFGAEGNASIDITKGREVLPANVKPLHYDLTLEPDFENFTYEGTVTIEYVAT